MIAKAFRGVATLYLDRVFLELLDTDCSLHRRCWRATQRPVTIKVIVDQRGFASTNGVTLQRDLIATQDNPVVANLRAAGAILLGRTNAPAFSFRWFTSNRLHGRTRNPRDPALTHGGSSGGAAAAVAAGIGAIGHGTDIAGSVRYPAHACGRGDRSGRRSAGAHRPGEVTGPALRARIRAMIAS